MNTAPEILNEFRTPESEIASHRHDYLFPRESFGDLDRFFQARTAATSFPLSFRHARFASIESWREKALEALESALKRPREAALASASCDQVIHRDGLIQEEWTLRTTLKQSIPATVVKPPGKNVRYPTIIALHDMGGMRLYGREKLLAQDKEPGYLVDFRQTNYEGSFLAESLARAGYLVITIDALGFGERIAEWGGGVRDVFERRATLSADDVPRANFRIAQAESAAARCATLAGTTWAGMIVQDDILTVDFACSRGDVDIDRIGCTGLSFGAYRTNYLAAVDERIKAAVSVCWHSTLDGIVGYNVGGAIGWFTLLPGLHQHMDLSDITALACPRSLLAISGWNDILMQPLGAIEAHRNLRQIWDKAGYSANLGSLFFSSEHEYNLNMQQAAIAWFGQKLK